jgi:hypothetical protein
MAVSKKRRHNHALFGLGTVEKRSGFSGTDYGKSISSDPLLPAAQPRYRMPIEENMEKIFSILLIVITATICYGVDLENLIRKDNETAQQFIERIIPDSLKVTHQIIETNIWDSTQKSIIVFYKKKNDSNEINEKAEVFCHLYMHPQDSDNYRDIEFGPIEAERGPIEILSVFFANADKDKEKELVVLTKYYTYHYDGSGDFYDAYIYDNPDIYYDELKYLSEISEKFSGCDCSSQEGGEWTAKYKTAASIKTKLKSLGY